MFLRCILSLKGDGLFQAVTVPSYGPPQIPKKAGSQRCSPMHITYFQRIIGPGCFHIVVLNPVFNVFHLIGIYFIRSQSKPFSARIIKGLMLQYFVCYAIRCFKVVHPGTQTADINFLFNVLKLYFP